MTRRFFTAGGLALCAAPALVAPATGREVTQPREYLDIPEAALWDVPSLEAAMFTDLNAERVRRNRATVTFDDQLTEVARAYARQMLNGRFIGHVAPDGTTFIQRLQRAGLAADHMGENLAYTTGDEPEAFLHLVQSPGHLANMLNPLFTRVGIGAIAIGLYGTMYVQEFEGD
jgi:uncharacterized protein YkwD